jgi:hypothetical protein
MFGTAAGSESTGTVHGTIQDEGKGTHEIHEGEIFRLEPGT